MWKLNSRQSGRAVGTPCPSVSSVVGFRARDLRSGRSVTSISLCAPSRLCSRVLLCPATRFPAAVCCSQPRIIRLVLRARPPVPGRCCVPCMHAFGDESLCVWCVRRVRVRCPALYMLPCRWEASAIIAARGGAGVLRPTRNRSLGAGACAATCARAAVAASLWRGAECGRA